MRISITAPLVMLALAAICQAQSLSIDQHVEAAGGGGMSGATLRIDGTISQPIVGAVSGSVYAIDQGFWIVGDCGTAGSNRSVRSSGTRAGTAWQAPLPDPAAMDGVGISAVGMSTLRLSVAPNLVGSTATVSWYLPRDGAVRIELYDAAGASAATLFDGHAAAGNTELTLDAARLPAGTYYLRLTTENEHVSRTVKIVR